MKVEQPGSGEMVPFSSLSVSGGLLNAYEAVKMAGTVKGKKKKSSKGASGGSGSGKGKSKDRV